MALRPSPANPDYLISLQHFAPSQMALLPLAWPNLAALSLPNHQLKVLHSIWASLMAQLVKNLPAMWETWVQSLGWEDPLEKGKATHSNILAWRIPWTIQSKRVRHDWAIFTCFFKFHLHLKGLSEMLLPLSLLSCPWFSPQHKCHYTFKDKIWANVYQTQTLNVLQTQSHLSFTTLIWSICSQFSLFLAVVFYKVTMNTELAKTKPLLLEEI